MSHNQRLKLSEMGELIKCAHCKKLTYKANDVPTGRLLPKGWTVARRRHIVHVHGARLTICETCRYNVYGRY